MARGYMAPDAKFTLWSQRPEPQPAKEMKSLVFRSTSLELTALCTTDHCSRDISEN